MRAREQLLNFFKQYPTRRPISRAALSGLLGVAYPTLDVTLEQLQHENMLEHTSCGEWRPSLAFVRLELAKREVVDERVTAAVSKIAIRRADADNKKRARREAQAQERMLKRMELETKRAQEREAARLVRLAERADRAMIRRLERELDEPTTPGKIPPAIVEIVPFTPRVSKPKDDAWARIRERHYGKPSYLGSEFKQDTRKMMGQR